MLFKSLRNRKVGNCGGVKRYAWVGLEPLESRQMLSIAPLGSGGPGQGGPGGPGQGPDGPHGPGGPLASTIEFSLAPTAVQTGLDSLAKADGLTDPTSTTPVALNNVNGIETYSVTLTSTGTVSRLTVDENGNPVTQPTQSTTTWATLDGTGAGSDSTAAAEISAIATALDLTAPTSTTVINVTTTSAGAVTYSVMLSKSSSSSSSSDATTAAAYIPANLAINVVVDSAGNPVGNQRLPFSVIPSSIQAALNNNAPTGATALADTSTQSVNVRTVDGVVTYSVPFTVSGTTTTVTVDLAGDLTSLPTTSTTTFDDLSSVVQGELQTLATADGFSGTITSTQGVTVLTEANGTILYSITVGASATDPSGTSHTFNIVLTVDANGNPTTLPGDQGGPVPPIYANPGDSGSGDDDGDSSSGTPVACPPDSSGSNGSGDDSSGSNSSGTAAGSDSGDTDSSGSSSSGSSSAAPAACPPDSSSSGSSSSNSGDSSTTATSPLVIGGAAVLSDISSPAVYGLVAKIVSGAANCSGSLAGLFVQFIPADADSAVQADLTKIGTDLKQSASDLKALDSSDRATLRSDTKAIQSAIKAMSSTLSPLQATLKTDAATWKAMLRSDEKAIHKDKNDATALAADQTKLATDQAAAFVALAGDVTAIVKAINANAGVQSAQQQLASDLPTIAADQTTLTTDLKTLVSDVESQDSAA
jgi:hypothetical protein